MSSSAIFQVLCNTEFGTEVCIIGSSKALGSWDPANAIRLSTGSRTFPVWHSLEVPLSFEAGVEFKCILVKGTDEDQSNKLIQWEDGPNRKLSSHSLGRTALISVVFQSEEPAMINFPVLQPLPGLSSRLAPSLRQEYVCEPSTNGTLVSLQASFETSRVDVLGSFTTPQWAVKLQMNLCHRTMTWWLILEDVLHAVEPGAHEFKYLVNGTTWVNNPLVPTTTTSVSCQNNVLVVAQSRKLSFELPKCMDELVDEIGSVTTTSPGLSRGSTPMSTACSDHSGSGSSLGSLQMFLSEASEESAVFEHEGSRGLSQPLPMCFDAAVFTRPKDGSGLGEDSYFIEAQHTLGVADGVGGMLQMLGHSSKPFADELMNGCRVAARKKNEEMGAGVNPSVVARDILRMGYERGTRDGASTAVVAHLQASRLGIATLGDSAVVVVRSSAIAFKSQIQQHEFNCPYQLCRIPVRHMKQMQKVMVKPSACLSFDVDVEEGDLVLVCTDGVIDNLFDEDILDLCDAMVAPAKARGLGLPDSSSTSAQEAATMICQAAYQRSVDRSTVTPFSTNVENLGRSGPQARGGKKDDITCVAAWVQPSTFERSRPRLGTC